MKNEQTPIDFQVNRDRLSEARFVPGAAIDSLADGQVLLAVERFALTSNNITYAVAGDMLDYWGFFPGEDRFGRIPAMGFGDVIASRNPGVPEGARFFGFYPMSTHLVIDARVSAGGMVDTAAHRANHAPTYRTYNRTDADPLHSPEREDQIALLRGLFMTSFLIDDFLDDSNFFGARASIVSSASSKTGIAAGFQLSARGRGPVIGLTSARNADFVRGLGCYDEVVLYDEIESLDASVPAVYIDMAGSGDFTNRVHRHYGDRLEHSCVVGVTHWGGTPRDNDLPGAEPTFFFAPSQIQKRAQDWGADGLQERIGAAWLRFVSFSDGWLKVVSGHGAHDVDRAYHDLLAGRVSPAEGHVLSVWEDARH
jgi:hypothetical protein